MEVEIKPRFINNQKEKHKEIFKENTFKEESFKGGSLNEEVNDVVVDIPNVPQTGVIEEGFWDSISKYKMIIFYSIVFTILICVIIYYFWKESQPLTVGNPINVVGQPPPLPPQQPPQQPPQLPPQQNKPTNTKLNKNNLANIINKTKNNIEQIKQPDSSYYVDDHQDNHQDNHQNNTRQNIQEYQKISDDDPVEAEYNKKEIKESESMETYISDESTENSVEDVSYTHIILATSEFTNQFDSNDNEDMKNRVEEVHDIINTISVPEVQKTHCNFTYKNKRKCGKITNGSDRCATHISA
jgi:hypothetical protein